MIDTFMRIIFVAIVAFIYSLIIHKIRKEPYVLSDFLVIYVAMLFGHFVVGEWILNTYFI